MDTEEKKPGLDRDIENVLGWEKGERDILWISSTRALFQPSSARGPFPQETPGVLRGDSSGSVFSHLQCKSTKYQH